MALFDGVKLPREELLKKEIPYEFIERLHGMYPDHEMVIMGVITQSEIDADMTFFSLTNATS